MTTHINKISDYLQRQNIYNSLLLVAYTVIGTQPDTTNATVSGHIHAVQLIAGQLNADS